MVPKLTNSYLHLLVVWLYICDSDWLDHLFFPGSTWFCLLASQQSLCIDGYFAACPWLLGFIHFPLIACSVLPFLTMTVCVKCNAIACIFVSLEYWLGTLPQQWCFHHRELVLGSSLCKAPPSFAQYPVLSVLFLHFAHLEVYHQVHLC